MKKRSIDTIRLLPPQAKYAAYAIIAVCILAVVLAKLKVVPFELKAVIAAAQSGVLAALLILTMTANEIEDELTLKIRLNAFMTAFMVGTLRVIIKPCMNLIFGKSILESMSTFELLFFMLLFYFAALNIQKRKFK